MAVFMLTCLLAGCGGKAPEVSVEEQLYGQWERVDGRADFSSVEFFDDGTYTSDSPNLQGNFSVTGNRIKFAGYLVSDVVETFEVEGDELHFLYDDGEVRCTFVRQ